MSDFTSDHDLRLETCDVFLTRAAASSHGQSGSSLDPSASGARWQITSESPSSPALRIPPPSWRHW